MRFCGRGGVRGAGDGQVNDPAGIAAIVIAAVMEGRLRCPEFVGAIRIRRERCA
jgi:hypothetical protein